MTVNPIRAGAGVLAVLVVWATGPVPVRAAVSGVCPADTTVETVTGSMGVELEFGFTKASPWEIDWDTGFLPKRKPLGLKAFFYASAGKLDIQSTSRITATWNTVDAIPGNTGFTLNLTGTGLANKSRWVNDGGLRYGSRYRYEIDVKGMTFEAEDYLPGVPNLDLSWPCDLSLTPFQFGVKQEMCPRTIGSGNKDCIANLFPGNLPASCDDELDFIPEVSFGLCLSDPEVDADTAGMSFPEACTPPICDPYGAVCGQLCGDPGLCALLSLREKRLEIPADGVQFGINNSSVSVTRPIPCSFSKATNGERVFRPEVGPFNYVADVLFDLVGKVEPRISFCFVQLLQMDFNVGATFCAPIFADLVIPGVNWTDPTATYEVPIRDPFVCDIAPSSGSVSAGQATNITWKTSWGAPDNCNCRVKIEYRSRIQGTSTWIDTVVVDPDTTNSGTYGWTPPVFSVCRDAQIRITFMDPDRAFLSELWGGIFTIDPDTPQVAVSQPAAGQRECVGQPMCITWSASDPCQLPGNAIVRLWPTAGAFPIFVSSGWPATGGTFCWTLPSDLDPSNDARISVTVSDGAHTVTVFGPFFSLINATTIMGADSIDTSGQDTVTFQLGMINSQDLLQGDNCWDGNQGEADFSHRPGGPDTIGVFVPDRGGMPGTLPGIYPVADLSPMDPPRFFTFHFATNPPGPLPGTSRVTLAVSPMAGSIGTQVDTLVSVFRTISGPVMQMTEHRLLLSGAAVVGLGGGGSPARFTVLPSFPNPFRAWTDVRFELPGPGEVTATVYDIAGRRVRSLFRGRLPGGSQALRWDGHLDTGLPAGAGVYQLVVRYGGTIQISRVVRLP